MRARATPTLLPLLLLSWGCAERDLEWNLVFESTTLEMQAARLDARILMGACPGGDVLWDEVVHPTRPTDSPPTLSPGTYCFAARAGNVGCEWFAAGERTLELPTEELVTITLSMQPSTSNCPAGMCNGDGTCGGDPANPPQTCLLGGCDQTCTSDCTATCDGGGCNQVCSGGGATDCTFTCAGGRCNVRCEDSTDCSSTCAGGDCNMECRGSITDCVFDCLAGGCTFTCEDPGSCVTSCLPMSCAGP